MLVSNNAYNGKHIPDPTAKAALDNIERQERLRDKTTKPRFETSASSKGGVSTIWKNEN